MRRRWVFVIAALVAWAVWITPAAGHPWGANAGAVGFLRFETVNELRETIDGVYVRKVGITTMDVPGSDGNARTGPFSSLNQIIGANARPINITATLPRLSRDHSEFIAVGYAAGCVRHPDLPFPGDISCSGIHPTNDGVYKRVYFDGQICDPSFRCRYWVRWLDALSTGATPSFQVQRNYISDCQCFKWRMWVGAAYKGEIFRSEGGVGHRPQMQQGTLAMGAESVTRGFPDANHEDHQRLNQYQDFVDVRWHHRGDPSASPPGASNYRFARAMRDVSPHGDPNSEWG